MTKAGPDTKAPDPRAPFGADPRRGSGPLITLGILYFAWFAALFWMAAFHTGR